MTRFSVKLLLLQKEFILGSPFVFLFFYLLFFGCTPGTTGSTPGEQPNILLFVADDWSWPHAGAYGDPFVSTPTFDRLSGEGLLFTHAYCAVSSCAPSRAALLTGMYPHQLETGANLWGSLSTKFPNYTSILAEQGYLVGHERKGWAPGNHAEGGYTHNPAGRRFENFRVFYDSLQADQPFCYWFGSKDPHRPYDKTKHLKSGATASSVTVPAFLPDVPGVRQDLLNYYAEVERFDEEVGEVISFLESKGKLDNTLIVITSDNGMPFPRAKATVYDAGSRVPMLMAWKNRIQTPRTITSFVNLIDLAPTFLTAAEVAVPSEMTGQHLFDIINGKVTENRNTVFLERERHAYVRAGNASYPVRAVRNQHFLYVKNLESHQWPAGDPELVYSVGPYGDVDGSPSKDYILANQNNVAVRHFYQLAFAKRDHQELYDLKSDPHQLENVAADPAYFDQKIRLDSLLEQWRVQSSDPRSMGEGDAFQGYPYYGGPAKVED